MTAFDAKPMDYELDEPFGHGLGCHLRSIGLGLEKINDGLNGE